MKFKYKDQTVTASSKVEAAKKITSDTKKDKADIEQLKELLENNCNFDKITIRKSSIEYYLYAINNKIKYEIYISNAGKIEVTANLNRPYIADDTITKSFKFNSEGAKKLESWVISINSYLEAVKAADKLYSAL